MSESIAEGKEQLIKEEALEQLHHLGLTPRMMVGSILDIGAEHAVLAQYFANKSSVQITSVDTVVSDENRGTVDEGDARRLPYQDKTFDMVIAHASVPNVFIGMYSPEYAEGSATEMKHAIRKTFHEMMRVLKPGKSAYISPVPFAENYEPQKVFKNSVLEEIHNLRAIGVATTLELLNIYTNPENNEKTELFRLTLKRPSAQEKHNI